MSRRNQQQKKKINPEQDKRKHNNRCILNIGKSVFIKMLPRCYYTDKYISDLLILQTGIDISSLLKTACLIWIQKRFVLLSPLITITTGYDYIEYPKQVKYITTLLDIASHEIEGDTGISDLHYLKNILSSTLYKRRELYIFTGTGANGKSLISDVLMKPLGITKQCRPTIPPRASTAPTVHWPTNNIAEPFFPLNLRRRKNYRYHGTGKHTCAPALSNGLRVQACLYPTHVV